MDGGDDMDSLFEGMELFTPSSSQFADSSENAPAILTPSKEAEATVITAPAAEAMSEPLDEDMFSDLTIVTPVQHVPEAVTHPSPLPSSSSSSSMRRQMVKKDENVNRLETNLQEAAKQFASMKVNLPRVMEEREQMCKEVNECRKRNMELESEKDVLKKEVERLEEETLYKEGQITILKDTLGSKHFDLLSGTDFSQAMTKRLSKCRFQRLRIDSGTAKAERSAALELSDLEEANLLLEEAHEAESEAEKLKLACDLKEDDEEEAKSCECFVSMELIASFGLKKLQELTESVPS
ncbi:hypothetical protein F2Q68_00024154 [Brassica cretica]|uniref:Uncharacterized protein n=1 Tax=Brassica cretica TaxID=69181 RepID=A0A8S9I9P1_BRACR|nr:hypothetical protein F2Q68_00024154 [Brassica cretica]